MPLTLSFLITIFTGIAQVIRGDDPSVRIFNVNGKDVRVTFSADLRFYGKYSGSKTGYLLLNPDGTGEYKYDYFGLAKPGCKPGPISLKWGFILDEGNNIVKFARDYGYSIPVIFVSTGESSFQGCRTNVLVDYLLDLSDGTIEVSSSDDWKKNP
jgi:hypothetical protein